MEPKPHVLLALTGSVATVKWPKLVAALSEFAEVRVACTEHGEHFLNIAEQYDPDGFAWARAAGFLAGPPLLWRDRDEWAAYTAVHADPVVHIDLRTWADVVLVAPLSANTLATLCGGGADNLVTCVLRAWPMTRGVGGRTCVAKPVVLAPAMNSAMWEHPTTGESLSRLVSWGMSVVPPATRVLACGEVGAGAMAGVEDIVLAVHTALRKQEGEEKGAAGGGQADHQPQQAADARWVHRAALALAALGVVTLGCLALRRELSALRGR